MKLRLYPIVLGALAALLGCFLSAAAPARAQGEGAPGAYLAESVTPEQAQRIQQIKNRYGPQIQQINLQIQSLKLSIAQQIRGGGSRAQVKSLVDQWNALERQRQSLLVDEIYDISDVLSPAQREPFLREVVEQLLK
ncbi:MAG TPA: hypothetical protein VNO81_04875 [Candidatus Nitrosotenuis sp.]|jgi:hypothetical protein|nr:hypothetical protein [Candidatus Nitrosotenuis sp.]